MPQPIYLWIVFALVVLAALVGLVVLLAGGRGRGGRDRSRPDLEPPAEEERKPLATKAVTPLRDRPRKAVTTTRPKQPTRPGEDEAAKGDGTTRRPSQPVPPMKREVDRAESSQKEAESSQEEAESSQEEAVAATTEALSDDQPDEQLRTEDTAPGPEDHPTEEQPAPTGGEEEADSAPVEAHEKPKLGDRVGRMQKLFGEYIPGIRKRKVDEETWEDLEEALLRCDVGVPYTSKLLDGLRERAEAEDVTEGPALIEMLASQIKDNMVSADRGLYLDPKVTNVWLVVGVNGTGKTTTIGKLGRSITDEGHRVLFAAGDTFRAAAADQLQLWAERVGADIVRGAEGADPSSIIFDSIERANARGYQLVLADTAGRLHTKANLMEELRKIRRVANKAKGEVTEVLLVLDATTGQNGLNQAKQFTDAVELTGVVLTKLDGTAKGGIALSIQDELGIPVKLVGLGEQADDLIPFEPDDFVDALLGS